MTCHGLGYNCLSCEVPKWHFSYSQGKSSFYFTRSIKDLQKRKQLVEEIEWWIKCHLFPEGAQNKQLNTIWP